MQFAVQFQAPASRFDSSMDERFGRPLAGFFGQGTLTLTEQGIEVHAKRHRYQINLTVGAVVGLALTGAGWPVHMGDGGQVGVWLVLSVILGAFLTSLVMSLGGPRSGTIPWSSIRQMKTVGGYGRVFADGGDLQFSVAHEAFRAMQGVAHQRGIRVV